MQSKLIRHAAVAVFGGLLAGSAQASIVLTFFPASDFSANTATMNATLGISGYTIDDFEFKTLIPNLTIKMSGFGVSNTTITSLSNLFDESVCGIFSNNSVWDGTHGAINIPNNQVSNCSTPANITKTIEFDYAGGTKSLGIGMGNFQSLSTPPSQFPITNHELFVNGVDEGALETLAGSKWTPGLARNAYLRVDANGGSKITSIGFENLRAADGLVFDHLAVAPVPEPAFAWPLLAGGLAILLRRYSTASKSRH